MPDVPHLPLPHLYLWEILNMNDLFGREIRYLRLSVTELCNLRCRYCMEEDGICKKTHGEMLTQEETLLAVETAASLGIHKVRITGGEPLVKPDLLSLCRRVAAVEGISQLCLTTNGTLLPPLAVPLREAGVRKINISLDTLQPEKYTYITRTGTLSQAMDGLYAALSAGFEQVKVNVVLIGGLNDDEILPLAQLTRQLPVDVRFIELMPMAKTHGFPPEAFLPCSAVLDRLPDARPLPHDGGVAQRYRLPGALGCIGLIRPISQHFCSRCDRLRLTADGKLKPCLHTAEEFSVKGLDREGMKAQFLRAAQAKPSCHGTLSPTQHSPAGRAMNKIGG